MKLKQLEWALGSVESFQNPKEQLEQYITPVHIAASTIYTAQMQNSDIAGCSVLDAGCGTGMLASAAALLDASYVLGLDSDLEALETFRSNMDELELSNVDAVCADFLHEDDLRLKGCFDTVLMNPPFGTKSSAGIDVKFLKRGIELATRSVYSMHKTTTREHIDHVIKSLGAKGSVVAELKYELPRTLRHHRKEVHVIHVDLWRTEPSREVVK